MMARITGDNGSPVTLHEMGTLSCTVIALIGTVLLALLGRPIPDVLMIIDSAAVTWIFARDSTSQVVSAVAGKTNGTGTNGATQ